MKKMRVLCAAVLALCVYLPPACADLVYSSPVTSERHWNEDVNITTNAIVNDGIVTGREGGGIYLYTPDGTDPIPVTMNGNHLVTIRANLGAGNDPKDKLYGIRTYGGHNSVTLGMVDVEAGYMSLIAQQGTFISVGDYSRLVTTGSHYGIHTSFQGHILVGSDALIQAGSKTGSTNLGYTVWAQGGGNTSTSAIDIGARAQISNTGNYTGEGAAVYAQNGGQITIGNDSKITSTGERDPVSKTNRYNIGVRADAGYMSPPASYYSLPAPYAELYLVPSVILLGDRVSINTDGRRYNMGIYATNRAVVLAGEDLTINTHGSEGSNYGVYADEGAQITIKSAYIETEGAESYGLIAWSPQEGQNSKITVTEGSHIKTMGADAYGVVAIDNGEVVLTGKHTIETDLENDSFALWAQDGGTITADGQMNILGGIYATSSGKINMTMQDGSYMKGYAGIDDTQTDELHMEMKNANWELSRYDSELSSLKMGTGATVDYTKQGSNLNLYAHDISGNGTFVMKTDVVGGNGDLLTVDTSDGDHKIKVMDQGSAPTTGDEAPLTLVKTGDGNAEFSLNGEENLADIGAWRYGLRRTLANEKHEQHPENRTAK